MTYHQCPQITGEILPRSRKVADSQVPLWGLRFSLALNNRKYRSYFHIPPPTPTDAIEIAMLSGGGDRMRPIY